MTASVIPALIVASHFQSSVLTQRL